MRSTQQIRDFRLIARLLDGRAKRLEDFADIYENLNKKTLKRDLYALSLVPEYQIAIFRREGVTYWRMDARIHPTQPPERPLKCRKCKKLKVLGEFYARQDLASGRDSVCVECERKRAAAWRRGIRQRGVRRRYPPRKRGKRFHQQQREYYQEHKEEILAKRKAYYDKNREDINRVARLKRAAKKGG